MAHCKKCGEDAEELFKVKIDGRQKKVCEDCVELLREEAEIAEASEAVVQDMMGFRGRR